MHKQFWLAVVILIYSFAACAQTPKTTMNTRFDIETYNKHKESGEYNFERNGLEVRQFNIAAGYVERVTKPGTHIDHYKEYYKNGVLKEAGDFFTKSDFRKGVWHYYNEQGVETKVIDYDKPFVFTFEKVLEFMKRNKLSLEDRWTSINRITDSKGSRWIVTHEDGYESGANLRMKHVNLDAVTGKVIDVKTSLHLNN